MRPKSAGEYARDLDAARKAIVDARNALARTYRLVDTGWQVIINLPESACSLAVGGQADVAFLVYKNSTLVNKSEQLADLLMRDPEGMRWIANLREIFLKFMEEFHSSSQHGNVMLPPSGDWVNSTTPRET